MRTRTVLVLVLSAYALGVASGVLVIVRARGGALAALREALEGKGGVSAPVVGLPAQTIPLEVMPWSPK